MTRQHDDSLPTALSVTHLHLLRVVGSEAKRADHQPVRILDAGCGDAHLLEYFQRNAHRYFPGRSVEVYGFDVDDHGIQTRGFFADALQRLHTTLPEIDWSTRLSLITVGDSWPFDDMQFDFVVTNQVYEHLVDMRAFLAEMHRVLRVRGFSANIFPVRSCIKEGHLGLPFAHAVRSHDIRAAYLALCERLGLDRFGPLVNQEGLTSDEYGRSRADYVDFLTKYRTWSEIAEAANDLGLRASYRYTPEFYWVKMASLLRFAPSPYPYKSDSRAGRDLVAFHLLKYVSGVTICFEKDNTYVAPSRHP